MEPEASVTDGVLGKTSQKDIQAMFFQNSRSARWAKVPIGKNIIYKGAEIIQEVAFDCWSWGLCRAAHALRGAPKTTCRPIGFRSAGIRDQLAYVTTSPG